MYGHKVVAEQIWGLVQARYHLLAETLRRKMEYDDLHVFATALQPSSQRR